MTTPSGQISFLDLMIEFGNPGGGNNDLGSFRVEQTVGEMIDLPLDEGVPRGPNISAALGGESISFGQLRGKSLNVIVHYKGTQERPGGARAKYNGNNDPNVPIIVIGGGKPNRPTNSSGTDVTIHVSGTLKGSQSHSRTQCSLKTGGGWETGTILNVNVGSEGKIIGAGGAGGDGARSYNEETESFNDGEDGEDGSSALGVAYSLTELTVQPGGKIVAGGGGGGGGGIAREDSENNNRQATGGGGGGGAGIPAGLKGVSGPPTDLTAYFNPIAGDTGSPSGVQGSDGSSTNGGGGGEGANNDGEAFGGGGGGGGAPDGEGGAKGEGGKTSTDGSAGQESGEGNGGNGGNGSGGEGESNGGEGGSSGYAIIVKDTDGSGNAVSIPSAGNIDGFIRIKGDILTESEFS